MKVCTKCGQNTEIDDRIIEPWWFVATVIALIIVTALLLACLSGRLDLCLAT